MHEVHTFKWVGVPFTSARTRWMFGSQRRFVRRLGVGHVHPEARVLPTDLAYGCHVDAFLEREFLQIDEV